MSAFGPGYAKLAQENGAVTKEAPPYMPTDPEQLADKLLLEGFHYGGDLAKAPDGTSYMKFQVVRHAAGTYVIENRLFALEKGYFTVPVVKRLF